MDFEPSELPNDILESEETANIIYSIREELMEKVMDECRKAYVKKQTVNFLVQCAYDALVKYLAMNFYYHPEPPDTGKLEWTADKPIEPSPKDTWAFDGVSIRPKIKESILNTKSMQDQTCEELKNPYCSNGGDADPCTCMKDNQQFKTDWDEKSEDSSIHPPSRVQFSPESSQSSVLVGISEHLGTSVASKDKMLETPTSSAADTIIKSLSDMGSIKKHKSEKFVCQTNKEGIPTPQNRGSQASMVELPPIRIKTKFESKPEEKRKKK